MPIGYINPLANPYIPQNTELMERKLGQLQQRQDVAEEMMAKQRQAALAAENVAPELRDAYIEWQKNNYNSMIDKTRGNFAKNYDQVLESINADVANPYHNLNKFVSEQAKLQQQSQLQGGVDYLTTNDIYKQIPGLVQDGQIRKDINYEALRHQGVMANDYDKYITSTYGDIAETARKRMGQSTYKSNPDLPGYLESKLWNNEKLNYNDIKLLMSKDDVYQAFLKSNPTALIDYRGHLKDDKGNNIFADKEKFAGYAAGLLASKTRDVEGNKIDLQADATFDKDRWWAGQEPPTTGNSYAQEGDGIIVKSPFKSYSEALANTAKMNPFQRAYVGQITTEVDNQILYSNPELKSVITKEKEVGNNFFKGYKIIDKNGNGTSIQDVKNNVQEIVQNASIMLGSDVNKVDIYSKILEVIGRNYKGVNLIPEAIKYAEELNKVYSSKEYKTLLNKRNSAFEKGLEISDREFLLPKEDKVRKHLDGIVSRMNLANYDIAMGKEAVNIEKTSNGYTVDGKAYAYDDIKFGGILEADPTFGINTAIQVQFGDKKLYLTPKRDMTKSLDGNIILDETMSILENYDAATQRSYVKRLADYYKFKEAGTYFK